MLQLEPLPDCIEQTRGATGRRNTTRHTEHVQQVVVKDEAHESRAHVDEQSSLSGPSL